MEQSILIAKKKKAVERNLTAMGQKIDELLAERERFKEEMMEIYDLAEIMYCYLKDQWEWKYGPEWTASLDRAKKFLEELK